MTTISIIGSGNMATTIGARAARHGHLVEIMSRDAAKARAAADQIGDGATVGTFGARPAGDIVIVAVLTPARLTWSRTTAMRWPGRSLSTSPTLSTPTPVES